MRTGTTRRPLLRLKAILWGGWRPRHFCRRTMVPYLCCGPGAELTVARVPGSKFERRCGQRCGCLPPQRSHVLAAREKAIRFPPSCNFPRFPSAQAQVYQNEDARSAYSWALHLVPGRAGQTELSKGSGGTWSSLNFHLDTN